ncbi:hypothetical protein BDZ97DRAFT_1756605 [Flammula alnicola]|nr:hypothetical protein BDZ97DRAFT_1756605 [Flammula alnicola]
MSTLKPRGQLRRLESSYLCPYLHVDVPSAPGRFQFEVLQQGQPAVPESRVESRARYGNSRACQGTPGRRSTDLYEPVWDNYGQLGTDNIVDPSLPATPSESLRRLGERNTRRWVHEGPLTLEDADMIFVRVSFAGVCTHMRRSRSRWRCNSNNIDTLSTRTQAQVRASHSIIISCKLKDREGFGWCRQCYSVLLQLQLQLILEYIRSHATRYDVI